MSEDEVSESVELAWETGFQRGREEAGKEAERTAARNWWKTYSDQQDRIRQLEALIRQFIDHGCACVCPECYEATRAALRAEPAGGGDQT